MTNHVPRTIQNDNRIAFPAHSAVLDYKNDDRHVNNKKKDDLYYGPCRGSVDATADISAKTPHNPKQLLNEGVTPEPNYILIGEVEKELNAFKERNRSEQGKLQQLNVSDLLQELTSSQKWQDLNDHNQHLYSGVKKRPAPQAPAQSNPGVPASKRSSSNEMPLPNSGVPKIYGASVNVDAEVRRIKETQDGNKFECRGGSMIEHGKTFEEEYLNASDVRKLQQVVNNDASDNISYEPKHFNISRLDKKNIVHDTLPPPQPPQPPQPPLLPPQPSSFSSSPTNQPTKKALMKPASADQDSYVGNFILRSRDEVRECSQVDTTVKLRPSDVKRHRSEMVEIFFIINNNDNKIL